MLFCLTVDVVGDGVVLAFGVEEVLEEGELWEVGDWCEVESVADNHDCGLSLLVWGPVWEGVGVGVACFGEVDPVLGHDLRDVGFDGSCHAGAVGVAVDEGHLGHVACPTLSAWEDGVFGVLVEVVEVDVGFSGLGLEVSPGVGGPGERAVAEDVGQCEVGFEVVVGWVYLEERVGPFGIGGAYEGLIVGGRHGSGEHAAFVAVGAYEDVDVVVFAVGVEFVLVVDYGIAVDTGPEGFEGSVINNIFKWGFAQLFD